jgi:hypothetical protein
MDYNRPLSGRKEGWAWKFFVRSFCKGHDDTVNDPFQFFNIIEILFSAVLHAQKSPDSAGYIFP